MPIYEYRCQGCSAEVEKLQKIADEPLRDCPKCGEPKLQRKISAAGFRLKGGGWYETDFKKSGKKNLAGEGNGDSGKGGGESGKSESAAAPAASSSTSSPAAPSAS